ncbi:hypothetical protein ACO0DA_05870 [Bacillus subtilis]|uniref:hypothetical protein n=1 Tax=Bacillus subtilis TaxID=1423 RepID=UPI00100A02E1|nr:hypothetical protein [Bacillus subtilis]MEC0400787.1 hypothetical protein [Bacillus subtilis]QAW06654.1 hypothetical protein ES968_22085 [Bacillus subtilis]
MGASKELYTSMGWRQPLTKEDPIFEVGQRFTINYGCQKNLFGAWEIIDNNDSPHYLCVKVLKNGKLSKGKNLNCKRLFYVSFIKQALKIQNVE